MRLGAHCCAPQLPARGRLAPVPALRRGSTLRRGWNVSHVPGGAFKAQDAARLVIPFQGSRSQRVLAARALDEGWQPATRWAFAVGGRFFTRETVQVRAARFDGRRAHDPAVKLRQPAVVLERDVRAPLRRIHAPVPTMPTASRHRHPARGHLLQHPMPPPRFKLWEPRWRRRKVTDGGAAVIGFLEAQPRRPPLPLPPVLAVTTKLEAKGRPVGRRRWHGPNSATLQSTQQGWPLPGLRWS